jgi:PTH1 family peptidyl-tRNA hydrolase
MTNWLIVGLGNPGREYAFTRHNIGFMAVDALSKEYGTGGDKVLFKSIARTALIDDQNVLLQKPQTFMNISGEAVGACARFYKTALENVIVLHDEIDIPFGTVKVKKGGGAAGHNGLKSIDQLLGKDYWRVRLGIGHPGDKDMVSDHVLSEFSKAEEKALEPLFKTLVENFPLMLQGKDKEFAAHFTKKSAAE